MARQKSDDKREAIVNATIRLLVEQGLGAPTASIARAAGIANGSLFTYFPTKTELYNQLYLELKTEMTTAAQEGVPAKAALRKRFSHVWTNWTSWAVEHRDRRRVLALLGTSDDITPATRAAGHEAMGPLIELMEQSRAKGPMRDAPLGLVASLANAVAEATMDYMVGDPAHADEHCKAGFEAVWRMLA